MMLPAPPTLGLLLALCACATDPLWTHEAALQPSFQQLDADASGLVEPAELQIHAYAAPRFEDLDLDHDGGMSPAELIGLVLAQDPLRFDGLPVRTPAAVRRSTASETNSPDAYFLEELLVFLGDAAQARDADVRIPDLPAMKRAARSTALDSPDAVQVLCQLAAAWRQVELEFPPQLQPVSCPATPAEAEPAR